MQEINVINLYANPSFNAKDEAMNYFCRETVDQYRGFSHQLDQLKYETETSLKESVYDHYTEFIGFSAEVQKMDDSMEQLKKNLTRTYTILDRLKDSSLTVENMNITENNLRSLVIPDNLAWLKSVNDDIDLLIFQRRFGEGVELCIKATTALNIPESSQNPLLKELSMKFSRKSEILTNNLVTELFSPDLSRSDRRRLCRLLTGLGHEEQARLLYLERASDEIRRHHQFVKPCGDIPSLIAGLSELFFECLQDVAVNFRLLFCTSDASIYSICLSWLVRETDAFVKQIIVYALGDDGENAIQDMTAFENFAGCLTPLLCGAMTLGEVGCQIDCQLMKVIGSKTAVVMRSVLSFIITHIKALSQPESDTQQITFKSLIGIEKREISVHAAAVYAELSGFIQQCPQLVTASLLPFIGPVLVDGFIAIFAHEGKLYERWTKDKTNRKQSVLLNDLYFWNTELLPIISQRFIMPMDQHGSRLSSAAEDKITSAVSAPQVNTVAGMKRLLYTVKQAEKVMPPASYNMMKKALYSSLFSLLAKDTRWSKMERGKFIETGFNSFVLDMAFIKVFAPTSVKPVSDAVIQKGLELTNNMELPSEKWITKSMSDAIKQCRK